MNALNILNIFKDLKQTMGKEVKKTRRMLYEQVGDMNKGIKIIKRNQVEILEVESKTVEMKKSLKFSSRP